MALILLVDDDPDVREVLRKDLQQEGHEVEEAANGQEALVAYRQNPADLVITDIFMPEKGGLELITELRSEFPNSKIFAMSAELPQRKANPLKIAEVLGAIRTFEKPMSLRALRGAIRGEIK
ncbi:response regulator [Candidatus Nitronereus thalassa]|uniref:Response regulator n=1 Tax=Candidatus Nitronereus thalassa TaxID=3020898 RepID=A0ABU3KB96_9BACT|nr:response regulator [Candidatus Nitronereus thalassa]MDT7043716.1 response regulator [Candidatus Nitronereus thalassa]